MSPYLPTWRVVALVGHDREVTPPSLPSLIVRDSSMEVSAGVGVQPVPIDLLESEVLRGQSVAQEISILPLPVL